MSPSCVQSPSPESPVPAPPLWVCAEGFCSPPKIANHSATRNANPGPLAIFPLPFGCAEEGGFPQHFGQPCGSFAFWGHGRQPSYRQKVMFPAFPSTPHMQPTQPPNPRGGGQRTTPVCQQPCGKPVRTCAHRCGRAFLIPNFLVPPPPPPPRSAISATTTPRPRTPHSQSRSDGPAA